MRRPPQIRMSPRLRRRLLGTARSPQTPQRLACRAQIALLSSQGESNHAIAERLGVNPKTVGLWRLRFAQVGLAGLHDRSGRGRKPVHDRDTIERVIQTTLIETPRRQAHWTTREMARRVGVSRSMVSRIWREAAIRPHLARTFRTQADRFLIDGLSRVMGVYASDEVRALTLAVRPQPSRHESPSAGKAAWRPYEHVAATGQALVAALRTLTEHVEMVPSAADADAAFADFLGQSMARVPGACHLHVLTDGYEACHRFSVRSWRQDVSRCHFLFLPRLPAWAHAVCCFLDTWRCERPDRVFMETSISLLSGIDSYLRSVHEDVTAGAFVWLS